jgi:hypothetical protein
MIKAGNAALLILRALLRVSPARRCPDAAANCKGASVCVDSTSACWGTLGGRNASLMCRSGLTGIFCRACAHENYYFVEAGDGVNATCKPCEKAVEDGLTSTLGLTLVVLALMALLASAFMFINSKLRGCFQRVYALVVHQYHLPKKLKVRCSHAAGPLSAVCFNPARF